jgi:hypothetical protein
MRLCGGQSVLLRALPFDSRKHDMMLGYMMPGYGFALRAPSWPLTELGQGGRSNCGFARHYEEE